MCSNGTVFNWLNCTGYVDAPVDFRADRSPTLSAMPSVPSVPKGVILTASQCSLKIVEYTVELPPTRSELLDKRQT